MQKMAIFVEGQTEQLFVDRLLREVAGEHQLRIEVRKGTGRRNSRHLRREYVTPEHPGVRYYVLIVDCSNDVSVVSDICDQYNWLIRNGYSQIVGLRDVYPNKLDNIRRMELALETALTAGIDSVTCKPDVLLAVMETEAWFIAEHTHFERIDESLECQSIKRRLRFNPAKVDVEKIAHPSKKLHQIYELAGKRYRKKEWETRRTVYALDFARLYLEVREQVPRFARLVDHIDTFLSRG